MILIEILMVRGLPEATACRNAQHRAQLKQLRVKLSNSARSLLSVLRRPTSSDLCRKRVIRKNPPKGKKRKASSSSCTTDPKSVTPAKRCLEFLDEPFEVSAGKLFCRSCREELSLKRSIIKNHIALLKHKTSKAARNKQQIADKSIVESLKAY